MRSAHPRVYLIAISLVFLACEVVRGTPPSQEYSKSGGVPRAWQAGVRATAESTVNMANINVLTSIPLFHWSGTGPAVNFSIYHNSLAAVSLVSATSGAGFTLGTAWRVSYGGQVVSINSRTARLDGPRQPPRITSRVRGPAPLHLPRKPGMAPHPGPRASSTASAYNPLSILAEDRERSQ